MLRGGSGGSDRSVMRFHRIDLYGEGIIKGVPLECPLERMGDFYTRG